MTLIATEGLAAARVGRRPFGGHQERDPATETELVEAWSDLLAARHADNQKAEV